VTTEKHAFVHTSVIIVRSQCLYFTHYTLVQIREQASHGGVRLPGAHALVTGEKDVSTGFDLTGIVKRGQFLRIQQHWFRVSRARTHI
jgi:hypothetical protein